MTLRNVDKTFSLEEQRQEINEIAVDLDAINTTLTNWNASQWDSAYSWGDHALAGYLTSYSETDTLATVTGRGATTNDDITLGDASNQPELNLSVGVSSGSVNYLKVFGGSNEVYFRNVDGSGGGGSINIQARTGVALWQDTGNLGLYIDSDCAANLYYQTALKLKTTTNGVDITGTLDVNGNTTVGAPDVTNASTGGVQVFQSGQLRIQRDGSGAATDKRFQMYFGTLEKVSITAGGDATFAGNLAVSGGDSSDWNTAYGWGDHGSAGYAADTNVANWDSAYGWGDHGSAGYLTSYTETQTLDDVLTLGASTTQDITTTGAVSTGGSLSIGSGSSAPADYGLIAYANTDSTSNKSSVYARNIGGGRNFTGDNSTGATTFEVYSSGSVKLTQSATSEITSLDTLNSGTGDNVLKIRTTANQGGNPYIKFDAGGSNMIVGQDWVGTTNNVLVLGTGEDPTSTLGIKIDGNGKFIHSGGKANNGAGSNLGDGGFYRITTSKLINQNDSKTFTIGGLQSGWMTVKAGGYSSAGQSQFALFLTMGGFMTATTTYNVIEQHNWGNGVTITTTKNAGNYQIILQNNSASYGLTCNFTIESSSSALNMSSN